jgi:hypothetical protein
LTKQFAALPPDVRKGSAFPNPSLKSVRLRLTRGIASINTYCATEGHRPSAHQAAKPHGIAQQYPYRLLLLLFTIFDSLFTAMIGFDRSALAGCTPFAAAIRKLRIE